MKSISSQLQALFATRQMMQANLFQFNMIDGTTLYFSGADVDISYGGHTYSAGGTVGPYFDRADNRATAHWKIGVEVDSLTFEALPGSYTLYGAPLAQAIKYGAFDGAELQMHRAYWAKGPWVSLLTPVGVIPNVFVGRVAEVDCSRSLATFNVNSHLELLNQNMPRDVYQAGCLNTLYDTGCTLNQASFAVAGTLLSGSSASALNFTLAQANGYFSLGKIKCVTGVNAGAWKGIRSHVAGSPAVIGLTSPFAQAPSAGDTFTLYPGCDKTQATCGSSKFNNLVNFRGFPYVPENQTAT